MSNFMIKYRLLTAALFSLLLPLTASSANWYVNPSSGNDGWLGNSVSTALKTLRKASEKTNPGDIVYLIGGTHNGFRDDFWDSGSSTSKITITPYNTTPVILDCSSTSGEWSSLVISGSDVVIDGKNLLTLRNNNSGRGVEVYRGTRVTIKGMKVHDIYRQGIMASGDYITIEGCEVFNTCKVNANGAMGNSGWPQAISSWVKTSGSPGAASTNFVYRNNYVHDNWGESIGAVAVDRVLFEGNRVRDGWSVYYYIDNAFNVTFRNNWAYTTVNTYNRFNRPATGVQLANEGYHEYSQNRRLENIQIYNNLFSNCGHGIFYWNATDNSTTTDTYHNVAIHHNVIYAPWSFAIYVEPVSGTAPATGTVQLRNNIIYKGGSGDIFLGNASAWTVSHNSWPTNATVPRGTNSTAGVNPSFVNPGNSNPPTDFKLKSTSPSSVKTGGYGVSSVVARDFWGTLRSTSTPSLGLHEYSATGTRVALAQEEAAKVTAFPVPGNTLINVTTAGQSVESEGVSLVDVRGRVIHTNYKLQSDGAIQLDVTRVPSGAYSLQIHTKEGLINKHISVQH